MSKNELNQRPDILDCIANLSNDEVFTSPFLVRKVLDLLPDDTWENENFKFLDPGSKTGIFLREIALRLNIGLKGKIPSLKKRINHIFQNQIFGISITELTLLMSKRSLYCSIHANGEKAISDIFDNKNGNLIYSNNKHFWDENKKRCIFCGAGFDIFNRDKKLENHAYEFIHTKKPEEIFKNMKFDVIVGNPPYQLKDGGHEASAKPIYQLFVDQAKKLNPKYLSMIIPARWYSGGKGLDKFRSEMLNDKRIRVLHDFIDASECFEMEYQLKGVSLLSWDRDNEGKCKIETHYKGKILSSETRYLLEDSNQTFIRYGKAIPIVKNKNLKKKLFTIVSSRKPYGLATNFDSKLKKSSNTMKFMPIKNIMLKKIALK